MKKSLQIRERYFLAIKSNQKPLEARCRYPSLRKLKKGDQIEFQCKQEYCTKTLKAVRRYSTVKDMLERESISQLLPGVTSLIEALEIYNSIYSPQKVEQNKGVLVFELE